MASVRRARGGERRLHGVVACWICSIYILAKRCCAQLRRRNAQRESASCSGSQWVAGARAASGGGSKACVRGASDTSPPPGRRWVRILGAERARGAPRPAERSQGARELVIGTATSSQGYGRLRQCSANGARKGHRALAGSGRRVMGVGRACHKCGVRGGRGFGRQITSEWSATSQDARKVNAR